MHSGDSTYSLQEKQLPDSEVSSIIPRASDSDIEKQPDKSTSSLSTSLTIHQGRPDVASIITSIVTSADRHDRVVVAVCGPSSMMQDARQAVAENIKVDGPSLELHSEHFGW
jgi:ferredoxin-NADP reductase